MRLFLLIFFVVLGCLAGLTAGGVAIAAHFFHRNISAWTDLSEMRAIVVELPGADDASIPELSEGTGRTLGPPEGRSVERGDGNLAGPPTGRDRHDTSSGEPY